ncbi:DUF927 domain-containing protein [Solimonas sp. SE-A11]|uniref:DUF927 domain-containing protein n=1 Tax=Solimonas sp. SE-A11 TaxID=3054954 RepID=UPI00259D0CFF|nr:DUF927 domain-containing protein [Solimonas sp. SE-A11]MDM4770843.1 DUF927 domain-containing protein [Solimonas sp. SE-A11]
MHSLSLADILDQFRAALAARGLVPHNIVADSFQRCPVEGAKKGKKDGAYILFTDGIPAGGFENHRDSGGWEKWQANIGRSLTKEEQEALRVRWEAAKQAREVEQAKLRQRAREKAAALWKQASETVRADHHYLQAKQVRAYGLRQLRESLVLPVHLGRDLVGLQFIRPDGGKMFLTGTEKKGAHFEIQGDGSAPEVVAIVEGYATGATVREATGWPVVVAFDKGNLVHVAKGLRKAWPAVQIVLAADNDHRTEGNPGVTAAQEAARLVQGLVAIPDFTEHAHGTDWNDYAAQHGLQAVRQALEAVQAGATASPGDSDVLAGSAEATAAAGAPSPPAPPDGQRDEEEDDGRAPLERFEVTARGVYWIGAYQDRKGRWREADPLFVCSPLHVEAVTRDTAGSGFGRLVAFDDLDGHRKELVLPSPLFGGGKGDELRGKLMNEGLPRVSLEAKAQRKLMEYLMHTAPAERARCVTSVGWHGTVYVLPQRCFGEANGERFFFGPGSSDENPYSQAGALDRWRDHVARPAGHHKRLMFALSCAFAGPLVALAGAESGGFHLVGGSSSGKTTAMRIASSVWGHPSNYLRQWRNSDNSLEYVAADFCDSLLCLDEIAQADPKIIGDVAYMLANQRGKERAKREGGLRANKKFRVLLLSTGEVGTAAQINASGQKSRAGHEVRMVEVPADAGKSFGLFDSGGDAGSARALAGNLVDMTTRHHGHAGPAYLERVVKERAQISNDARQRIKDFVENACPNGADGQVLRVAARFGLVTYAGELATGYGLTGWRYQEIEDACLHAFNSWLELRGTAGAKEPKDMIAQVRRFIEENGAAQFPLIDDEKDGYPSNNKLPYQSGWRKSGANGALIYMCFRERFRSVICNGYDYRDVCAALQKAGMLITDGGTGEARYTKKMPAPNVTTRMHFYVIDGNMLFSSVA